MDTVDITPRKAAVLPLAMIGHDALGQFAAALEGEPRYFGPTTTPRPSARWSSMLCHPSRPVGVGAIIDAELVGVARLCPDESEHLALYVAVAGPWRRGGIPTRLVDAALSVAASMGDTSVVAIAEHRKAPVRLLLRKFNVEPSPSLSSAGQVRVLVPSAS